MLSEKDLQTLEKGHFYLYQIAGCSVVTKNGENIGEVDDILSVRQNDLLVVKKGNKEILIPFSEAICLEVNLEKKEIIINPPEGLLELNEI